MDAFGRGAGVTIPITNTRDLRIMGRGWTGGRPMKKAARSESRISRINSLARILLYRGRVATNGSKPSARFVAEVGVSRRAHTVHAREWRKGKRKGKRESRNV